MDTRHHALEATKVDVGTTVELVEDLVSIFLNLILDVHFATLLVLLFAGESVVETEIVGVLLLDRLPLVIVEEGITVGDAEEKPGLALVSIGGGRVLDKKATDETTVGSNLCV